MEPEIPPILSHLPIEPRPDFWNKYVLAFVSGTTVFEASRPMRIGLDDLFCHEASITTRQADKR